MGISTSLLSSHDDSLHVGNAKRNQINGLCGLGSLGRVLDMQAPRRLPNISGSFAFEEFTQVQGYWVEIFMPGQTDYSVDWVSTTAFRTPNAPAQNDEIKIPALVLEAGTYLFVISTTTDPGSGIIELLHNGVSMGTFDSYSAAPVLNVRATFNYSPPSRVQGDFQIRCPNKNAASTGYAIKLSRLKILQTA